MVEGRGFRQRTRAAREARAGLWSGEEGGGGGSSMENDFDAGLGRAG